MLTVKNAKRIGREACINAIGRDFVMANKDTAAAAYGATEDGIFCFIGVGNAAEPANDGALILDSTSKFLYSASCNVSLTDGAVTFLECNILI